MKIVIHTINIQTGSVEVEFQNPLSLTEDQLAGVQAEDQTTFMDIRRTIIAPRDYTGRFVRELIFSRIEAETQGVIAEAQHHWDLYCLDRDLEALEGLENLE